MFQKMQKKRTRRIYYLHKKVKDAGFFIDAPNRQIDVGPFTKLSEIPVGPRYYVQQLIKSGYNVQLKLL